MSLKNIKMGFLKILFMSLKTLQKNFYNNKNTINRFLHMFLYCKK